MSNHSATTRRNATSKQAGNIGDGWAYLWSSVFGFVIGAWWFNDELKQFQRYEDPEYDWQTLKPLIESGALTLFSGIVGGILIIWILKEKAKARRLSRTGAGLA